MGIHPRQVPVRKIPMTVLLGERSIKGGVVGPG